MFTSRQHEPSFQPPSTSTQYTSVPDTNFIGNIPQDQQPFLQTPSSRANSIGAWMDELDPYCDAQSQMMSTPTMNQITMQMLCNQNLP